MPSLAADLRLALDRVSFASSLGLDPDPWQERLLRSTSPRVLLNCSRQSGKSTMSGVIALHRALYFPGSLVLCLAPSERQSKELFAKVSDSYRRLRGTPAPASDRKLGMHLPNGSRIEALPGSEKTVRGFSGTSLLIVDEAARVDDELYYAVRPMLAVSGGTLMMLTTPYGKRGAFFEEWTSVAGREWDRYEVSAAECPRRSVEFLAEERAALPTYIYRQEYECSFEDTEDQIFTHDMVQAAVTPDIKPLFGGG
ncbi:MAG: terminase family protein [Rubrobacteraceae bacterium]